MGASMAQFGYLLVPVLVMRTRPPTTRRVRACAGAALRIDPVTQPASHVNAPTQLSWRRGDTYSFLFIALTAGITRFVGLGTHTASDTPVFDEKHYVPQAFEMTQSREGFLIGGIEGNPGYGLVVHPPLGKRLIAIGENIFGYTPLGWRVMVALFGVLTVLATMALARRLAGGYLVPLLAGVIAVCDGVMVVSSRFGMLDMFQVTFVILAAYFLVRDHQQAHARLYSSWHAARAAGGEPCPALPGGALGPRIGFRWWRFAAGVALGCATAVKWSGLYYMAFFGLATVAADATLRHRFNVRRPIVGALIRDAVPAFASLVLVAFAVYAWSWRSWFASETAVYRHAATDGSIDADSWLNHLPPTLASWLYYHQSVLDFHADLTTSNGHSHPWDSKPWSWLVAARPILYLSSTGIECGAGECRRMIYLFGTPAIWWLTIPALLWALWSILVRRDYRFVVPVIGFAAGFLPWLAAYDRQMYFFYAVGLAPFLAIILALWASQLVERGPLLHWRWVRSLAGRPLPVGTLIVVGYVALVVGMFCYFMPIIYGGMISDSWFDSMMWLPSWR